jgi:hypothetical protein
MSGNLASIGFPVKDEVEFTNLAVSTIKRGDQAKIKRAVFHRLQINDGIELLAISVKGLIGCFKPYFKSTSTLKVTLTDTFLPGDCEFEKKIIASSISDENGIPILFDFAYFNKVPEKIDTSREYDLHLTAFAQSIQCYDSKEEFSEKNPKLAPNYYIPSGTFNPNSTKPRNDSEAIFAGEVLDTKVITNSETKQKIRWIKVKTLIGTLDVVTDESELQKKPVINGIIKGQYWLIGEIDFPILPAKKSILNIFKK